MFSHSHDSVSIPTRRHRYLATVAVALLAVSASGIATAVDHAETAQSPRHGAMDDDHLKRLIQFVLARIDEPQKEQVERLAHDALEDLQGFERKSEAVRAPRAQILLADVVDRAALERARVAELHIADERSQRVNHLLIDIAAVLTPQQRAVLRTEMAD